MPRREPVLRRRRTDRWIGRVGERVADRSFPGGDGITFSTIAAQLIQRAVVGLRHPDEDLFAFPS